MPSMGGSREGSGGDRGDGGSSKGGATGRGSGADSGGSDSGGSRSFGSPDAAYSREQALSKEKEAAQKAKEKAAIDAYNALSSLIGTPAPKSVADSFAEKRARMNAFELTDPSQKALNRGIRAGIPGTKEYGARVKQEATAAYRNASLREDRNALASGRLAQAISTQRGFNLSDPVGLSAYASYDPSLSPLERSALMAEAAKQNPEVAASSFNKDYGTDLSASDISAMAARGEDLSALGAALSKGIVSVDNGTISVNKLGTLGHAYKDIGLQLGAIFGAPLIGAAIPGIYGMLASKALPALGLQGLGPSSYLGTISNIQDIAGLHTRLGLRPATHLSNPSAQSFSMQSLYNKFSNILGN